MDGDGYGPRPQRAAFALDAQRPGNLWQYQRGPQAGCLSIHPGGAPSAPAGWLATTASPPAGSAGDSVRFESFNRPLRAARQTGR